jgi:hypothetical protein
MSAEAYPLQWPEGWPRTPSYQRKSSSVFQSRVYQITLERARSGLEQTLRLLEARNIVLSTNIPLRADGAPRSGAERMNMDVGVAVYFTLRKRQMVMAQDAFDKVAGNVRSLALAVDGMRQMQRHGGGHMMERAFTGFLAITPPDWKKPWREVMSAAKDWRPSPSELASHYRKLANERHPDRGGSDTLMAELNVAYSEAKREIETP